MYMRRLSSDDAGNFCSLVLISHNAWGNVNLFFCHVLCHLVIHLRRFDLSCRRAAGRCLFLKGPKKGDLPTSSPRNLFQRFTPCFSGFCPIKISGEDWASYGSHRHMLTVQRIPLKQSSPSCSRLPAGYFIFVASFPFCVGLSVRALVLIVSH